MMLYTNIGARNKIKIIQDSLFDTWHLLFTSIGHFQLSECCQISFLEPSYFDTSVNYSPPAGHIWDLQESSGRRCCRSDGPEDAMGFHLPPSLFCSRHSHSSAIWESLSTTLRYWHRRVWYNEKEHRPNFIHMAGFNPIDIRMLDVGL